MARTDRHRPHWVQLADRLEQNWYWFDQGNRFGWRKILIHRACGDRLCGGYYWRKESNRRGRHQAQRQAREVVKGGDGE